MNNQSPPETTPSEFNLMDYKILDVEFTCTDVQFLVSFEGSNDIKDGGKVKLYVYSSVPQTLTFSELPIPIKAAAQKGSFDVDFSAAVKSFDIKFNLDDQPLFIVRFDATDLSVWFMSYDLAGDEMSSLCIRKPGSVKPEVAQATESSEQPFIFGDGYETEWWVNRVMKGGQHAVVELLEFTDRLFREGGCNHKATSDLDLLRRELFRHSDTFDSALCLYERRHCFKISLGSPDEMIERIITEESHGFIGDDQKGGDE